MPPSPGPSAPTFGLLGVLGISVVAAALGGAGFRIFGSRASDPAAAPAAPARTDVTGTRPVRPETAGALIRMPEPQPLPSLSPGAGVAAGDLQLLTELTSRIAQRAVGSMEVQAAEGLFARYPLDAKIGDLLEGVLLTAAQQEQGRRHFTEALTLARRAAALRASSLPPRVVILGVLLETTDWGAAESAARDALAIDARNADALEGLGLALFRQDRNREAVEVLEAALQVRNRPETRALLDRILRGMADERGMKDQHLSHFNVRYDGDAHDEVGREILGFLERHYATLASVLDHQPAAAIPVILFSRDAYFDASGAPAWSGGAYDNIDGRIRIPIAGLSSSLNSHLEGVLIHEVTHAFVADRTQGRAPRDLHEGLAQYMEGKRVESLLDAEDLAALADGPVGGVQGYYLGALAYVEYLMAQRGQGGINDLLRAMGETGSVDEAFQQVYGHDQAGTVKAWRARFRQQHGH